MDTIKLYGATPKVSGEPEQGNYSVATEHDDGSLTFATDPETGKIRRFNGQDGARNYADSKIDNAREFGVELACGYRPRSTKQKKEGSVAGAVHAEEAANETE